jgi:hypothetical protein
MGFLLFSFFWADFDLAYNMYFAQMERTEITVAQRSVLVPTLLSQLSAQPSIHAASKVKLYAL